MKASEVSGINDMGWYGSIVEMAGTPDRLGAVERSNVMDFFTVLSYGKSKARYNEEYNKK